MEELLKAAELIRRNAGDVVALTGADMSTDSGIPTFRGSSGLWSKYKPEELSYIECVPKEPDNRSEDEEQSVQAKAQAKPP